MREPELVLHDAAGHATAFATVTDLSATRRPRHTAGAGTAVRKHRAVHRLPLAATVGAHDAAPHVVPVLTVPVALPSHASWAVAGKRVLDVVGATIGLVLTAPLLLVLAILIRLESPGPVLFRQPRLGLNGRHFRCLKLRTMRADAEQILQADPGLRREYERHDFKLPTCADHRVTTLGRILRLTSLDELPQFWNVLRGEMSLVGPRPIVPEELVHYGAQRALLCSVRPGVTGAWAVGGRSRINYPERAAIELEYVRQWSLAGDLVILARTVVAVLQRRGAY